MLKIKDFGKSSFNKNGEEILDIIKKYFDGKALPRNEYLNEISKDRGTEKQKSYQQMVNEIREKYPNAYTPWTKKDDELLLLLYKKGVKRKEIAQKFKRRPSAIYSRLKKLGVFNLFK